MKALVLTSEQIAHLTNEEVVYLITTMGRSGKYSNQVKRFNNEKHFENWYNLVSRKGLKVIGVEKK